MLLIPRGSLPSMKHLKLFVVAFLLPVVVMPIVEAGGRQEETPQGSEIEIESANDESEAEDQRDTEPRASSESGSDQSPSEDAEAQPVWVIADHELNDSLEREISGLVARGYTPVGMETSDSGVSILYLQTPDIVFSRWVIHEFTELDRLNQEMSEFLVEGWVPTGFTKDGDSITALFVLSEDTSVRGWRIHNVPAGDTQQLINVTEAYIQDGFVPFGLSIDDSDDRVWILFLETPVSPGGNPRPNLLINAFEEEAIADGLTGDLAQGAVPWAMSRETDVSFFLYLF